jgi:hypothetical protein
MGDISTWTPAHIIVAIMAAVGVVIAASAFVWFFLNIFLWFRDEC